MPLQIRASALRRIAISPFPEQMLIAFNAFRFR
jgi:hypothetical protein